MKCPSAPLSSSYFLLLSQFKSRVPFVSNTEALLLTLDIFATHFFKTFFQADLGTFLLIT